MNDNGKLYFNQEIEGNRRVVYHHPATRYAVCHRGDHFQCPFSVVRLDEQNQVVYEELHEQLVVAANSLQFHIKNALSVFPSFTS